MSVHQDQDVVEGAGNTPVAESTVTTRRASGGPGQILGGLAGLVLTVVGVLAVVRSGIDGSMNSPRADVFGLQQSALVGAVEVVIGLVMIAGAASAWNRSLLGFSGGIVFVAGIIVAAASTKILKDLGTTKSTGAFMIVIGVVAMVSAMLPTFTRSTSHARVETRV